MDGSSGGRIPGLDCFLRLLWVLVPRERLGSVGCCFLLREDDDILEVSYFIAAFVDEVLAGLVVDGVG